MEKLLLDIQLAKPLFLWLLGLPLLWVRVRDQRLLVILARTIILLLLISVSPTLNGFTDRLGKKSESSLLTFRRA